MVCPCLTRSLHIDEVQLWRGSQVLISDNIRTYSKRAPWLFHIPVASRREGISICPFSPASIREDGGVSEQVHIGRRGSLGCTAERRELGTGTRSFRDPISHSCISQMQGQQDEPFSAHHMANERAETRKLRSDLPAFQTVRPFCLPHTRRRHTHQRRHDSSLYLYHTCTTYLHVLCPHEPLLLCHRRTALTTVIPSLMRLPRSRVLGFQSVHTAYRNVHYDAIRRHCNCNTQKDAGCPE